jgi:dTDP-4-dehydrorhamnose reductase
MSLRAYLQYISTDFIFDGFDGPYKEEDHPNPINYYGKSKLKGEELVLNSGLQYAIIRTVLVYGVGQDLQRSNLVLWVKNKLQRGEHIRVVDDQWRNPTLVEDLAIGCKLVLEKGAYGIYNVAGKEYLTPFDIAMKTADIFSLDKNLISPTNAVKFKEVARRPLKTGFFITKARENLGYEPVTLERGLQIVKKQVANLEKTGSR